MRYNILSFLAAFVVTSIIFAGYAFLRPPENIAYASNVMGNVIQNFSDNNAQLLAVRRLRQEIAQSPDALLDIYGRDALTVFDAPEMVRRDVPTTVWQYRNDTCVLDLYFTTQKRSAQNAPVVHYEVRLRGGDSLTDEMRVVCVRSLARARGGFSFVNVNAAYKAH